MSLPFLGDTVRVPWESPPVASRHRLRRVVGGGRGGNLQESISVNPAIGRLSLVLGSAVAELAGHNILLTPTVAAPQQLAWVGVPVGIAAKYLSVNCRK